jgi:renalase
MNSCMIIGAGLSGLIAARTLQNAGITVTVLEREQKVGGRMRTDRVQNGVFDHGAQFFTVRSDRFEEIAQTWLSAGVAQEWTRGFADATGEQNEDGHPRYKGTRGMTAITEHLAQDLDIRAGLEVKELHETGQSWEVVAEGSTHTADALILTAPAPAALALVDSNGISLPSKAREALQSISYQPCIAVMALLDGPGEVPEPGGVQVGGDPLFWVADNYQKGISEVPAVTIHAGPEWSREHAHSDDAKVSDLLLREAKDYLGTSVKATAVYRWQYSMPASSYEEQFIYAEGPPPLVFCGDAYAGPKVEGATLSGLAAAEKLLEAR